MVQISYVAHWWRLVGAAQVALNTLHQRLFYEIGLAIMPHEWHHHWLASHQLLMFQGLEHGLLLLVLKLLLKLLLVLLVLESVGCCRR